MLQFWICSHMTCMVTTMKRRRRRMTIWRQCWPVWVDAGGESGLGAPCLARTRCCCRPPLLLLLLLLLQTPTLPVSSDPPRHTHPLLLQQISSLFQTFNFCKYKVRLPRRGQNSQKYLVFSPPVSNGCYLIQKAKAFTHSNSPARDIYHQVHMWSFASIWAIEIFVFTSKKCSDKTIAKWCFSSKPLFLNQSNR